MKTIGRNKVWVAGGLALLYLSSCSLAPKATSRDKSGKEAKDEKSFAFSDAPSDGRPVVYADSMPISNIDMTRLHPSSADFYGVSATDVRIVTDPANIEILWGFTNMQESIPVRVLIDAVKRACQTEGLGSIKSCLDTVIKKSSAVVFMPKVPLTQSTDPNDENLIRDVAFNTLGVKVVDVIDLNGAHVESVMGACVGCHSTSVTRTNSSGGKSLHLNFAGDNAIADALYTGEFDRYKTLFSNMINNPGDAFWQTSAKAKAAGLLAAQYEKLRSIHGAQMYATDSDLQRYSREASASRVVSSGWVYAMMAFSTTARQSCEWGNDLGHSTDPALVNCGTGALTSSIVASRTERVTLQEFLPNGSRYNITQSLLLTGAPDSIPSREMRSQLPPAGHENTSISQGMDEFSGQHTSLRNKNRNFALEYVDFTNDWRGSLAATDSEYATKRYLLGATSISAVMPSSIDQSLATSWYGAGVTSAQAKDRIYAALPRTVVHNFDDDSQAYHAARKTPPMSADSSFSPTLSQAEASAAQSYMDGQCYSCHTSGTMDLGYFTVTQCANGSTCDLLSRDRSDLTTEFLNYKNTPTSGFAQRIMAAIGALPEAMSGLPGLKPTADIVSKPHRLPLLFRQALTDWSYASFSEALSAAPHAPQFAVLSPVSDINGKAQVRRMQVNVDLGYTSRAAPQELRCLKSASFDLDGNGSRESSCYDTLRTLSGASPRALGVSDAIAGHAAVAKPGQLGISAESVGKYLQAIDVGGLNIQDGAGTKYIKFVYSDERL